MTDLVSGNPKEEKITHSPNRRIWLAVGINRATCRFKASQSSSGTHDLSGGHSTRLPEMFENCFGLRFGYDRRQRGYVGLLHGLQAAEVFQQAAGRGFSDAGDFS